MRRIGGGTRPSRPRSWATAGSSTSRASSAATPRRSARGRRNWRDGRPGHRARPKKGGGRKRRIVVEPALAENFLKVLEDHTAGDPMRGDVKWTNLSRGQIAKRMGALGTPVSRDVVSQLLGSTATAGARR